MLIRSQDKEDIVNLDTAAIISTSKLSAERVRIGITSAIGQPTLYNIGEYSSMEKAKKVLDMISDAYSSCLYHHGRMREFETEDYKPSQWAYVPEFAFIPPSVFQMPLDSEVEVGTE